ncbi:MAG: DUF1178 family protein [Planktomarina sp.]
MIKYSLKCSEGHMFESWFQSSEAFDALKSAGHLTCAVCGTADVERSLMAPAVKSSRKVDVPTKEQPDPTQIEKAFKEMRKEVEKNSEYVGGNFAKEARAMHLGESPERSIYGEAKPEEAKSLIEDGINVAPLPFVPKRQTN